MMQRDVLHFIDNTAAQASLIRGSSSVESGDVIVGLTGLYVVQLKARPWFDRVASDSNPVDGLSRGIMSGPWSHVIKLRLPPELHSCIQAELQ